MLRRPVILMYTGVVSNWKQGSPYGFVKDTDTGASYFLHKDDIVDGSRNRVNSLPEGFRVEFDKAMFEGRTKAVAVTLRGGAPITSTGERRRDDDRDDYRRRDDDRDDYRRSRRDDDRDDYRRRDDDRDDRRRDDRRDVRRDDRDRESAAYDRELSRIQGSLAAVSRAEQINAKQQMKLYHALVSIAHKKGVVVPAYDDADAKEKNISRWTKYNEETVERKEAAIQRRAERRAERVAQRDAGSAEQEAKGSQSRAKAADLDAEDMF